MTVVEHGVAIGCACDGPTLWHCSDDVETAAAVSGLATGMP